jgi:TRAP-type C4-dicarboxylate transport system substrate-binding protein
MKRVELVIGLCVVLLTGCFVFGTTCSSAPVTMRVSIATPEKHFVSQSFAEWCKLIEEKSEGEIKVQLYYSAQLFRDNEVIRAIQTGAVEAGNAQSQYLENQLVPGMKVLQLPFFFKKLEEVLKVINSSIGDDWRKTAEQKGVLLVGTVSYPSPDGVNDHQTSQSPG